MANNREHSTDQTYRQPPDLPESAERRGVSQARVAPEELVCGSRAVLEELFGNIGQIGAQRNASDGQNYFGIGGYPNLGFFRKAAHHSDWRNAFVKNTTRDSVIIDTNIVENPVYGKTDDPSIENPEAFRLFLTKGGREVFLTLCVHNLLKLSKNQITLSTLCAYAKIFRDYERGELAARLEAKFQFKADSLK